MTDLPVIPLAGVIGQPVAHSRSPALHSYWLRRYGLKGAYVPMDVDRADLGRVLDAMPRMGFVGANVTIPHKEAVLALADVVTDRAALIGAANTLVFRRDGRLQADNTDGAGFIANLRQHVPNWQPTVGAAAVLGAGGAARAVIAALIEAGVPEIRLSNRTHARSDALRADFGAKIRVYDWTAMAATISGATTVVNTTSLGMVGKQELTVPVEALRPGAVVTDLVYTPLKTRFLQDAAARGCHVVDGLGMLLHQAAPGFERWFGQRPEVDEATRQAVLAS
jgi:shikimate dehydrogenase